MIPNDGSMLIYHGRKSKKNTLHKQKFETGCLGFQTPLQKVVPWLKLFLFNGCESTNCDIGTGINKYEIRLWFWYTPQKIKAKSFESDWLVNVQEFPHNHTLQKKIPCLCQQVWLKLHSKNVPTYLWNIPQTPPWPNSLCFGIPESFGISGDVRGKLQGVCWGSLRFMKIPPSSHMDVSEKRGTPKSSILIGFYHYKPSILGVFPLFLVQHPYPQPTRRTNWPRTRRWHNRPSHGVT